MFYILTYLNTAEAGAEHPFKRQLHTTHVAVKGRLCRAFSPISADGYAMLMRPNKAETAVHGCHCPGDMAECMRKVLVRPWVDIRVCHLILLFFYNFPAQ